VVPMPTKGAILCGGEGRRLKPLTDYFQKTMIPIGPRRRPLLEYVVRLLAFHKITDIVMLTGYRSEEIENYFGDGSRFRANIGYSRDATPGGGSANALEHALESGKLGDFDNLLVYYGDVLSDLNLTELLAVHNARSAAVTLVLSDRYTLPVGVADVMDGFVRRFREKPSLGLTVTTGCMVVRRDTLGTLAKATSKGGRKDLMAHFVPEVLGSGERVAGYYFKGFWYDVGTTEAYEKLENGLIETHLKFLG
jgi:mannose-1-phosphate guanylyltransferase